MKTDMTLPCEWCGAETPFDLIEEVNYLIESRETTCLDFVCPVCVEKAREQQSDVDTESEYVYE